MGAARGVCIKTILTYRSSDNKQAGDPDWQSALEHIKEPLVSKVSFLNAHNNYSFLFYMHENIIMQIY